MEGPREFVLMQCRIREFSRDNGAVCVRFSITQLPNYAFTKSRRTPLLSRKNGRERSRRSEVEWRTKRVSPTRQVSGPDFSRADEVLFLCLPDRPRTTLSLPKGRRAGVKGSRCSFPHHAASGSFLVANGQWVFDFQLLNYQITHLPNLAEPLCHCERRVMSEAEGEVRLATLLPAPEPKGERTWPGCGSPG